MKIGKAVGNIGRLALGAGRMFVVAGLLIAAALFGASAAMAQTITGAIRGAVTDPSGAVVAGAG